MNNIYNDFVSQEPRKFRFMLGRYIASSLSGFIAGVVVASVVWITGISIMNLFS